jgi:hypothetical protein
MRITCACGRSLVVRDELAGKRVKCPGCGEILTVAQPGPAKAKPAARATPDEAAPRPKAAPAAPAKARRPAAEDDVQPAAKKTPPPKARPREDEDEENDRPRRKRDRDDDGNRPRRKKKAKPASMPFWARWVILGGGGVAGLAAALVVAFIVLGPKKPPVKETRTTSAGGDQAGNTGGGGGGEPAAVGLRGQKHVVSMVYSPDGKHLATGITDQTQVNGEKAIRLWDLTSPQEPVTLQGDAGRIDSLAYSPDGKLLGSADGEGHELKVWDLATGKLRHLDRMDGNAPRLGSLPVSFSPDGKYLVALRPGACVLMDATSGRVSTQEVGMVLNGWQQVAFSPAAPVLAMSQLFREERRVLVTVYDYAAQAERHRFNLSMLPVTMAFSGDGRALAIATSDGPILVFDTKTWQQRASLDRKRQIPQFLNFKRLALTDDGGFVCALPEQSGRPKAEVWPVGSAQETRQLDVGWCFAFAIAPDGKTVAAATDEGVRFADPATGQEKQSGVGSPAASRAITVTWPESVGAQAGAGRSPQQATAYLRQRRYGLTVDEKRPGRPVVGVTGYAVNVTTADVQALKDLGSLEWLTFYSSPLPPGSLSTLKDIPSLRELSITIGRDAPTPALSEVGTLQQLRVLYVASCKEPDTLMESVASLVNLEHLSVGDARGLTDAGLRKLKNLPRLHGLSTDSAQLTPAGLTELRHLQELHWGCPPDAPIDLAELQALRELQSLFVSKRLTDADLKAIAGIGSLRKLQIDLSAATDAGLAQLKRLEHLQQLSLSASGFTGKGFGALKALAELRELRVYDASDAVLRAVASYPSLERLNLRLGAGATDAGFNRLRGLPHLHRLEVTDANRLTDKLWAAVKGMRQLEQFALRNDRVTGRGIGQLKELPRLRGLWLSCRIMSDAAMQELKEVQTLRQLFLARVRVTDAGLRQLAALRNLRVLSVDSNAATGGGMEALRKALPNTKIDQTYRPGLPDAD